MTRCVTCRRFPQKKKQKVWSSRADRMCLNNNFEGEKCSALFSWGRACGPAHRRTSSVKNCLFRFAGQRKHLPRFLPTKIKRKNFIMVSQNEKETLSEKKKKGSSMEQKNGRLNGRLPDRIILLFLRLLKKNIRGRFVGNVSSSGEKSD